MIKREVRIEGRSGCRILFDERRENAVLKFSNSPEYNERLEKQHAKQSLFYHMYRLKHGFTTPELIRIGYDQENGLSWFEMQYIPGETYREYLVRATKQEIDLMIDRYFLFLEMLFDEAKSGLIPRPIITEKIESVRKAILANGIRFDGLLDNVFRFLQDNMPDVPLPLGFCHGDFTLSNAIFCDDQVFLIDFLDAFIESPLIDLVKLRQDTKFYWTLQLEKNLLSFQRNKIIQTLRYFDNRIVTHFQCNDYYIGWYQYLEKFNLVRILPYLSNSCEVSFVIKCLKEERA